MLRLVVFPILWLCLSLEGFSQAETEFRDTTWNQVDIHGKKQGYWKKYYPDSTLFYKGFFKNDIPEGEFRRFYENGMLKTFLYYCPDGIKTYAKFYYQNGILAAEGKYTKQEKDSIWNYYSMHTNTLSYTESYREGMKDGVSLKYYSNGHLAEKLYWKQNMKHGEWKQYYDDGTLRLSSNYADNKLNGDYFVYNSEGLLMLQGKYTGNLANGTWIYYNDEGGIEFELEHDHGKILNEEVLQERVKKYVEDMEKNIGTIPEPDFDNIIPDIR